MFCRRFLEVAIAVCCTGVAIPSDSKERSTFGTMAKGPNLSVFNAKQANGVAAIKGTSATALSRTADRLGASGLAHVGAVRSHKRNAMFELYAARQAAYSTCFPVKILYASTSLFTTEWLVSDELLPCTSRWAITSCSDIAARYHGRILGNGPFERGSSRRAGEQAA